MSPCFQKLRDNLRSFIQPLNQASFEIRYGLLAYNAGADGRNAIYEHTFIGGNDPALVKGLYSPQVNADKYFTPDANKFLSALESVRTQGDENTLLALDTAADFPFRTPDESRRVIALFTNEKLEDGILENEPLDKFPQVLQKIAKRKISLYAYLPTSDSAALLTRLPKTFVKSVGEGADCWDHIDFGQILEQMGKSISQSSLQMTREPDYQKAVYGQDTWDPGSFVGTGDSRREKILATGESAKLNMSKPLEWIHVKLFWKQKVDLDLHAIWSFRGKNYHVYFHNKRQQDVELDIDEGVGESGGAVGGYKEENITISTLNRIEKMLIATKNYTESGCFADYDGKVVVETSNGDNITVPLTSQSRDVWCVIAAIDNSDQRAPEVKNLNQTSRNDPAVEDFI
jgi:uncharacterized protein involved in tellurium resistance